MANYGSTQPWDVTSPSCSVVQWYSALNTCRDVCAKLSLSKLTLSDSYKVRVPPLPTCQICSITVVLPIYMLLSLWAALSSSNSSLFMECGPKKILTEKITQSLKTNSTTCANLSGWKRKQCGTNLLWIVKLFLLLWVIFLVSMPFWGFCYS